MLDLHTHKYTHKNAHFLSKEDLHKHKKRNLFFQEFSYKKYLENLRNKTLIDVITNSNYESNVFLEYKVLHKKEFFEFINENQNKVFMQSVPYELNRFVKDYDAFLKKVGYVNRNSRYATKLKVLYPKTILVHKNKERFIKEVLKNINFLSNVNLHYIVMNEKVKQCEFAHIVILERTYITNCQYKVYLSNKYIDSRTGLWAAKNCPTKYKVLKCKKGDFVLDKNGNKIKLSYAVFSKGLRLFRFSVDKNGRNMFEEFMRDLKMKVVNALKKIVASGVTNGKIITKKQNKYSYHNLIRRRIAAINHAKTMVEYTTNCVLKMEEKYTVYDQKAYEKAVYLSNKDHTDLNIHEIPKIYSKIYMGMISIFEKYKSYFKKECFHDSLGNVLYIKHYFQRVDELETNIRILLQMFENDVHELLC